MNGNDEPPAPPPWWRRLSDNIWNEFFYRVQVLSTPLYKGMRWAYWDFDSRKDSILVTASSIRDAYI